MRYKCAHLVMIHGFEKIPRNNGHEMIYKHKRIRRASTQQSLETII